MYPSVRQTYILNFATAQYAPANWKSCVTQARYVTQAPSPWLHFPMRQEKEFPQESKLEVWTDHFTTLEQ